MDMNTPAAVQASARPASLVWCPHPLVPSEGRVVEMSPPTGSETLRAYLQRLGVDLSGPVIVAIDRTVIPCHWLDRVRPKPGTIITVHAAVAGDDGSQVVAVVAMIALTIAAPYLAGAMYGLATSGVALTSAQAAVWAANSVIGMAMTTGITVAGSMLISALTPKPKVDLGRAMSVAKDSPTYSLAGGSNQSRPYEPLALTLGRHRVFFDLASRPYTVNVGDDQYLYQVFHVGMHGGQGALRVEDLRIGDTPLTSYSGVVTQYSEDAMPTLMPYNVDTIAGAAVSVAGGPVVRTTSVDTTRIELDLQFILFYSADTGLIGRAVDVQLEYRAVGASTWLPVGDAPSYGYYTHYWSQGYTYTPLAGMGEPYWRQTAYDGNRSPTAHTDGVGGWWWRPYAERPVSDPAPPDYLTNSSAVLHITGASATPTRRTYGIDVSKGQYEVRVTRVSPDETDSRATSDINLVAVKSYQSQAGSFGGQTFLAVKVLASGQLNGTLATLSGIVSQPVSPGVYSSNPADLFLLFARGYRTGGRLAWGAGLLDAEIDMASVDAWRTWCDTKQLTCNIHIDSAKSVWDILQAITRCGRGSPSWATGKLGVLWDAASLPVIAVFGPSNIKQGSFEVVYGSEAAADEITLTYINADDNWQTDTIRVAAPGVTTPKKPASMELWGVTNRDQAIRECRLQAAQQVYRSRMVSWVADMEGLVVTRGDVVMLSHDMTQWGTSGRLVAGTTFTLTLDRAITLSSSGSWITVVSPTGTLTTCRVQYAAGEVDVITLLDPLPTAPDSDSPMDWRWIADYKATPGKRVKITDIKPASMHEVRITAMDDPDEYYAFESGTYTPPAVTPWTSSDPTLTGLRFAEERVTAGAGFSLALVATWSEQGAIAARRVRYRVSGGPWIDLGLVDGSSVRVDIPSSGTVDLAVWGYDGAGRVPSSATLSGSHTIVGRYVLPTAVTGLSVNAAADGTRVVTWAVAAVPADIAYIELRYAASSGTAWASMSVLAVVPYRAGRYETSLPAAGAWTFEARLMDGSGAYSNTGPRVTVTLGAPPVGAVVGANRLYNSSRSVVGGNDDGWSTWTNAAGGIGGGAVEAGFVDSGTWHLVGGVSRYLHAVGTPAAGLMAEWSSWAQKIPVIPGQRYQAHALTGAQRCTAAVCINWLDGTDSLIQQDVVGSNVGAKPGGLLLSDWLLTGGFSTAPAGAVKGVLVVSLRDSTGADPYVFLDQCFLGDAGANQTVLSPWADGARTVTNTAQLTDGAGLGTTAEWSGVSGSGKPQDNATVGAAFGVNISGQITPDNAGTYVANGAMGTGQLGDQAATSVMQAGSAIYLGLIAGSATAIGFFDLLQEASTGAVVAMTSSGMLWPSGATEVFCSITAIPGTPSGSGLGLPWGTEYTLVPEFTINKFALADERAYSVSTSFVLPHVENIRIFVKLRSDSTFMNVKQSTRIEVIKR